MSASISVLALLAAGVSMASCATEEADPEEPGAGTGGTEDATGGAGGADEATGGTQSVATGGAAGASNCEPCKGEAPVDCPLLKPASAMLLDFDSCEPGAADCQFGSWAPGELTGGTFTYPHTVDECAEDQTPPAYPIVSDFSQGNWHITGTVGTYSGFGIWLGSCPLGDLSDYAGFTFTVSGDVGPSGTMTFRVSSASNTAPKVAPDVTCHPNAATCSASTCDADSNYIVDVTAEPTTVEVRWADLTGGSPNSNPDPSEITSFGFYVDYVGSTFELDLVIDDLGLIPVQ